jgi:hypothetical protein
MPSQLGEMTLKDAAREAAGNWRHFECFCWHRARDLVRPDDWCIVYGRHRDSGLLDQSNAAAIEEAMEPFTAGDDPDVVPETHSHWAVGWIDGFSIRVFKRGRITKAFRTYHELAQRLADYPLLDEEDFSRREYEDTIANLADAAWRLKREYDLPKGWESAAYDWFSENDCSAIESSDDRGGYPSEDQLRQAFEALGYQQTATV